MKFYIWIQHFCTQGFLIADNQNIVFVFRGTEIDQKSDIIADVKIPLKPFSLPGLTVGGNVHHGFYDALSPVFPDLYQALLKYKNPNQPQDVWFSGHSLGAALATLAAVCCVAKGESVSGLYTFGSPRVGDDEFRTKFKSYGLWNKTYRVVNCNDIVTMVPTPTLIPYHHVGIPIRIDNDGAFLIGEEFWQHFTRNLQDRLVSKLKALAEANGKTLLSDDSALADHYLFNGNGTGYIQQLQKGQA